MKIQFLFILFLHNTEQKRPKLNQRKVKERIQGNTADCSFLQLSDRYSFSKQNNEMHIKSRVYLTKNSNECNKFFLDGDNEGVDIVTIDDISLHIKDVSHCSDDTPVIELSDFTFQGLPCNLPNDITIYTGLGSERFQADT